MAVTCALSEAQKDMIYQMQELALTMDDLRQYLDTHLYDQFAISRFNMAQAEYHELMATYNSTYGPSISIAMNKDEKNWLWALQDFPWDY